jgi:hypothetical protein
MNRWTLIGAALVRGVTSASAGKNLEVAIKVGQ